MDIPAGILISCSNYYNPHITGALEIVKLGDVFFQKKIPRVSSGDGTTFSPPKKVSEEKHHLWPSEETGFAMNVPLGFLHHIEKKNYLVVEPNRLKNMRTMKLDHFPRDPGWKFQKVFELPPPRKFDDHHLKFLGLMFNLPVAEFRPQKINGWNLKVTHLERKIIFQPSCSSLSWKFQPLRSQFPSTWNP